MPLIKVHIPSTESPSAKPVLVKRLKEVMTEKLQIDDKVGQVFLYETQPQYRAVHADKGERFVFIEILMYPGRSLEMKASFMQGLIDETSRILNIDSKSINVCIIEVASENWYGGLSREYLEIIKGKK